ncbi:universal stress protein [Roseibium litorale]|uniref:Universal stress protein n=1 Tax=Roseibium litorale TaxID=2803841 RepID=A0ABR9CPI6_9HYPH|nr:universal stress protein [Roseibium litorale]MBD8892683.1 universal stress protein [Roseibium litorale]
MNYNVLMVHLDIDDPSDQRIQIAWQMAEEFEADLIGFCACNTYMPAPVDGDGGFEAQFLVQQTDDINRHLTMLRDRFEQVTGDSERATWRGLVGDPTGLLTKHARAADLIVSGRLEEDLQSNDFRNVDTGSLVLSSGRPVLLAGGDKSSFSADRILIGWKNTREARRAVIDALPLLRRASDVLLASVEASLNDEVKESIADVVRYLMKHGVKVRSEILLSSSHVGDTLLGTAHAMKADLIVAGGFGHSRLREWVFGGATRTLIADGSVHRFLSN